MIYIPAGLLQLGEIREYTGFCVARDKIIYSQKSEENYGKQSVKDELDVARTMVYLNKKTQHACKSRKAARDYINNERDRNDLRKALVEYSVGKIATPDACLDSLIRQVGNKHGVPYSTMYKYTKRAAENDTIDADIIVKKRGRPSLINEREVWPIVQKHAEKCSYCPSVVRDELLAIYTNLTKDQVMQYVKQTFRRLVEKYQREKILGKSLGKAQPGKSTGLELAPVSTYGGKPGKS